MSVAKRVVLRDLIVFQLKLLLDGLKDLVLSPLALGAAAVDLILPGPRVGNIFYAVVRLGERFDRWLNLWGAAHHADAEQGGLFAASRGGSDSLITRIEEIVSARGDARAQRRSAG